MKSTKQSKSAPVKVAAKANPKSPIASPSKFMAIVANVGGAVVATVFVMTLFAHNEPDPQNTTDTHLNSGYDWLLNTMLKGNLETIEKYPDLNTEQRYEAKWGPGEIPYLFKVKKATPENAVVLLPPKKLLTEVNFKSSLDLPFVTYFLYPRKVVYEDNKEQDTLYSKVTHLVSVNGWGFDKLNYQLQKPEGFMVLPLKQ